MTKAARVVFLFAIGTLSLAGPAHAAVWKAEKPWDLATEAQYSAWVQNDLKTDFFSKAAVAETAPFTVPLDIGMTKVDLPYVMRAVFAYQNKLPYLIRSSVDSAVFFTNENSRFDSLPEGDERFVAFMKEVVTRHASYDGLRRDTFPVAMDKQSLVPGTLHLVNRPLWDEKFQDIKVVKRTDDFGFMSFIFALTEKNPSTAPLIERAPVIQEQPDNHDGFIAFRWPRPNPQQGLQDHLGDARYSIAQYRNEFSKEIQGVPFTYLVQKKVSGTEVTQLRKLQQEMMDLCLHLGQRVQWVNEAQAYLAEKRKMDPMFEMKKGSKDYELYSTPARDRIIKERFTADLVKYKLGSAVIARELANEALCKLEYMPGKTLTLAEYKERMVAGKLSNNPNDSIGKRWGEAE